MSFGFPAYHEERFPIPASLHPNWVLAASQSLGWNGQWLVQDPNTFQAACSLNLLSWGEKIRITRVAADCLLVRSECSFPTQCFDWGRNKHNVQAFCASLERLARQERAWNPATR